MARTKRSRRNYAGEWGRNRVRVFPDPKTGLFQIEWRENGRRLTRSLTHHDSRHHGVDVWGREPSGRWQAPVFEGRAVHSPFLSDRSRASKAEDW